MERLQRPRAGRRHREADRKDLSCRQELNYNGFNLAYTTVEDMIRLNHALLAGRLISKQSLDAMLTPAFPPNPNDPHPLLLGYEALTSRATATTYKAVLEGVVSGGGENDEGIQNGFFVDVTVSPEAGALEILFINDSAYFTGDDDNAFDSLISK